MLHAANPVDLPFIGPFGISKRGLVLFSTTGVSPQSFFEVGLAEQGPKATRTADSAFRKVVHGADGSRERAELAPGASGLLPRCPNVVIRSEYHP